MLKALLWRVQKEIRSLLLETGKQILVILAESLAELCPAVLWKAECVRDELEYQAEHISKQSVEGGVWFGLVSSCC